MKLRKLIRAITLNIHPNILQFCSETMAILSNNSLHIAVIGAGPIGLFLAIGLVNRGVQVTVYEKTSELKEIGVGIGFPENFVECMKLLDARLEVSLKKIAIKDSSGLRWVNGFTQEDIRKRPESKLFDMELPKEDGFTSYVCHRAELVAEMVNLLPTGTLHLGKQVAELDYGDLNTNCTLKFADGTTAKVDAGMLFHSSLRVLTLTNRTVSPNGPQ